MLLLKALARLVELLLMAAIALVGIGVGLYCLSGLISLGSARPDRLLNLPVVRARVGHFLAQLAAPGPTAVLALIGGIVAVLVGLLLLIGLLGSRRERLLVLEDDGPGGLYVRPRTVSRMVRDETALTPGVTAVRRPKVRLARSGRSGRVKVLASRGTEPDPATVDRSAHERVDPVTEQLGLRNDIRVRLSEPRATRELREREASLMTRQRVNIRRGTGALLVRMLTIVFACALIYGGVMDALLSLKLAPSLGPDKINRLTDYRTVYHWLAGLHRGNFTTPISLIAGFTGLLVFLFFAGLVLGLLPRPYFTRTEVDLPDIARGATVVRPRAVERIAEVAAEMSEHVIGVTGRLGTGELHVDVGIDAAPEAAQTLADVRRRVSEQLARHDLPPMPINVTLTGYERPTRRDSP